MFCLINACVFVCHTEQLEAFKKHMEAGETNTPAIIMGEEIEEETENGQLSMCVRACDKKGLSWHVHNRKPYHRINVCVSLFVCRRKGGWVKFWGPQQSVRGNHWERGQQCFPEQRCQLQEGEQPQQQYQEGGMSLLTLLTTELLTLTIYTARDLKGCFYQKLDRSNYNILCLYHWVISIK